MKYNLLTTCCFLAILFFSSCSNGQKSVNSLPIINIETSIKEMLEIELSQFTDNLKYVPLSTYNNMVFTGIWDCAFSDSLLIAKDLSKCLMYNYEGKFILKIGNKGRGPGEYQYSMNTVFGSNNKIYMQSLYDLLEYNVDGSFSNKYQNIFLHNNDYIASWLPIQDSLIFGKVASSTGKEKYKALIFDKNGNVKYYFENYIHFNRKKPLAGESEQHANIYTFQKNIYFKESFNDTLFLLTDRYQLVPEFIITLGKFEKPLPEREDLSMEAMRRMGDYMSVGNVFQISNYLFLDCFFSNQFPAKRLTPRVVFGDITSMYNTKSVLGIYDINKRELVFCKPTSTDNPLFTSGLFNDIDAGPRFFPKKMVNDSTMVMWIDAKQLKDHVSSEDFKTLTPKYPEKKKALEDFSNSLSEYDNAVLMFVTINKNEF
jgi:hypothetical protein